ncbi:MAG: hypothetical protein P4L31_00135 [Candidatus Babeliales bacterium]|nr:hypothetical protein [Candidatus Babeliales bacterium]
MGTLLSTSHTIGLSPVAHQNIFVAAFFILASTILSHSIFNQEKQIKQISIHENGKRRDYSTS